ncbi:MAG: phosphatase PAP2 family protein [Desulfovibrionales bacterium]|nr:MAG: phosphatase PAP2 family protein [Desulfovibrionales bacterium]
MPTKLETESVLKPGLWNRLSSSALVWWIGTSGLIGLLLSIPLVHGDLPATAWAIHLQQDVPWLQWWSDFSDRSLFQGGPPGAQDTTYITIVLALILYGCTFFPAWAAKAKHVRLAAGYYLSCMLLFLVTNRGMKALFQRARPLDVLRGEQTFSSIWLIGSYGFSEAASKGSFTSGHTTTAMFLVPLGIFMWYSSHRLVAWFVLFLALGWGGLVGTGRVLRGSHYPGDVLWAIIVCLWISIVVASLFFKLEKRSKALAVPRVWELRLGIWIALGMCALFAFLISIVQLVYQPTWFWPLVAILGVLSAWFSFFRVAQFIRQ